MNDTVKSRFPKSILCILTACVILFSGFTTTASAVVQENYLPVTTDNAYEQKGDVVIPLGLINYNVSQQTITGLFDTGAFGGFNKDLRQDIYYASQNCWQRNFGYCKFYDNAAPYFFMNFECLRFYFNYDKRDWLIQVWKGQYGITTGCEVGIYNKSENNNSSLYKCASDADRLPISVTLYHNGSMMFYRPMETTWWQTGFRLFKTYRSNVLGMKFSIDFKNNEMLSAFLGSITSDMRITYTVSGTTFNASWDI